MYVMYMKYMIYYHFIYVTKYLKYFDVFIKSSVLFVCVFKFYTYFLSNIIFIHNGWSALLKRMSGVYFIILSHIYLPEYYDT